MGSMMETGADAVSVEGSTDEKHGYNPLAYRTAGQEPVAYDHLEAMSSAVSSSSSIAEQTVRVTDYCNAEEFSSVDLH